MKRNQIVLLAHRAGIRKFLRIMRLTILIFILGISQTFALTSFAQQKLNLQLSNVTVERALDELESKSEYFFLYNRNAVNVDRVIDLNVQDQSIEAVLDQIFKGTGISYEVKERQILLKSVDTNGYGSSQQALTVTGVISGSDGLPIPGATIVVKGTTTGTITDLDGKYSISNVPGNSILQFSFVGMKLLEVPVAGKTEISVTLEEETIGLEEVVAIGYGVVKKKDLTGAVASVKGEELANMPVPDVSQAMQGRLMGVNVVSQDGRPGADVSIRIRGGGSITQSNDPLFVVDGFPVSSISDIPADQIESIDVLKDASSTAIYGARGANGVILVTTKNGKSGKINVQYSGYVQVKSAANTLSTLSAQEYIKHNWSYTSAYGASNADGIAQYFGLGSAYGNHYDDYANVSAHNYTDDALRTAFTNSHNITVSGGSEKTKVYASIGHIYDEGIKINSGFKRTNAAFKIDQELSDNLKMNVDFRYFESELNSRESTTNGRGSLLSSAYWYRPIDNPLGDVDYTEVSSAFGNGDANIDESQNVVNLINDVTDLTKSQNLRGFAGLDWEIAKGLQAHTEVGLTRTHSTRNYYEDGLTNGYKTATITKKAGESLRSVTTLNYELNLNENNRLSFLLGNEILKSNSETTTVYGRGYPDNFDYETTLGLIQTANTATSFSNEFSVPSHTLSFFGRVNYNLKEKYLLTATFRADGSSKFAPNQRWGYFPAAAAAWRVSEEDFLQDVSWLDNLKLRLSYGAAGSDNINPGLWKETWESGSSSNIHYPINGDIGTYYAPEGLLANPDLKWETTVSRNLGIDYGLFNNRIFGVIETYYNTTKDLLMAVPIDNTTGYSYQYQNFGQTSNKGFEISVGGDIIRSSDLTLGVNVIYNYNHNKIDKLSDTDEYQYGSRWASTATQPAYDYVLAEGKSVGVIRGYVSEGYYTVDDFNYDNGVYTLKEGIADFSKQFTGNYPNPFTVADGQNAFPGAIKLKDITEDGEVNTDDYTDLGEAMPKHTGSVNLNLKYKNFDLSTNFNWVLGGKIYNASALVSTYGNKDNTIGANRLSFVADAYQVYDIDGNGDIYAVTDPTELTALNKNAKYALPYYENGITYSTFVEDGSYLRLQTVTLGYQVPKQASAKLGIESIRLYFTANNVFTITGYSGIDPEVNASPTANSSYFSDLKIFPTTNMDWGTYPRARTYTLGLNVTF
ncbi:TonB-dependent receptor [Mangrovibacterium lignilyticum]|uniref:TonB-dependent receptor n=1 Tax=Mangrovibacterium lignilyticum TaxID=2668052 RepID=UPI0019675701|nr:TonB-dependent receptor [Mangrovibacterium lignilyticum]